jgi:DNA invertase Pin-like site-specific DNA recombinase
MKRKIGLYVRTATDEDNLAENQRKKLLTFAEFLIGTDPNWGEVVGEYVDNGISGVKRERPALNQMFEDIRQGKVDTILIQDEARLSRNFEHFISMVQELQSRQVKIHFLNRLTPMPSLEKTINANKFVGDIIERFRIQKDKDQVEANTGTNG